MATPSDIHREYVGAILARDWERVKGLLHPDYTYMGPDGQEAAGAEAALEVAQTYTGAFPDLKIELTSVHVAGSTAIAEMSAQGTHNGDLMGIPPTGKPVSMKVCNVVELRDGKILREREYYDSMSMMVQLGVVTPPGQSVASR